MLRIILLLIALLPLKVCLAQPETAPGAGDGSSGNPYQIRTLANLNWVSADPSRWAFHYIQTDDISAGPTSGWFGGQGFRPIGNLFDPFTGTYDGQGFTITDLTINRLVNYVGLFGAASMAEINNVNLVNANITGSGNVGALCGYAIRVIMFDNNASGTVTAPGDRIGGLVGYSQQCFIAFCTANVIVNGRTSVGGLIGYNNLSNGISFNIAFGNVTASGNEAGGLIGYNTRTLIDLCDAHGNVQGASSVGGLIGHNNNAAPVSGCRAFGNAVGSLDQVGGFIGFNQAGSNIQNCESSGNATGRTYIGGFIGVNNNNCAISNSRSTPLTVNGSQYIGGFIGYNLSTCLISNSFSTAEVTGTGQSYFGGFIGYNSHSNITGCYATGEVTGDRYHAGGLIGYNINSVLTNCRATGDVILLFASAIYAGGLVGTNSTNSHLYHCYSDGNVFAKDQAGGLVGRNENNSNIYYGCGGYGFVESNNSSGGLVGLNDGSIIFGSVSEQPVFTNGNYVGGLVGMNQNGSLVSNSFSQSLVTNGAHAGGLVGRNANSTIIDSYSIGFVGSGSNAGGLVGSNTGTVTNSFWNTETSGYAASSGGTGKTTAEMMNVATFTMMGTPGLTSPWDFDGDPYDDVGAADYWNMDLWMVGGYPHLIDNQCMIRQLPVTLLTFNVYCEDKGVRLSWQTASELNSEKFIILRSSDTETWEEIGSVTAAGNSSTTIQYYFTDSDPKFDGTVYYKLKQMDYDGKFKFYGPAISNCFNNSLSDSYIFPNPVSEGEFNIFVNTLYDEMCTITVTSIEGKHIDSFECQLFSGSNYIYVDDIHLPVGVYFVSISTIYKQTTHKMMVLNEICGYKTRSKF